MKVTGELNRGTLKSPSPGVGDRRRESGSGSTVEGTATVVRLFTRRVGGEDETGGTMTLSVVVLGEKGKLVTGEAEEERAGSIATREYQRVGLRDCKWGIKGVTRGQRGSRDGGRRRQKYMEI